VIVSNISPPLLFVLENDEFDINKEAKWGVSNATSSGSD